MQPLPYARAAILLPLSADEVPEPCAVIAIGFADFLVVKLDGSTAVAPFAEVQFTEMAYREVAGDAEREMRRAADPIQLAETAA